jgi:hypothetical protein
MNPMDGASSMSYYLVEITTHFCKKVGWNEDEARKWIRFPGAGSRNYDNRRVIAVHHGLSAFPSCHMCEHDAMDICFSVGKHCPVFPQIVPSWSKATGIGPI